MKVPFFFVLFIISSIFVTNIEIYDHLKGQKKEYSNLIKEHLKKRGITQTWLAKEFKTTF